MIRRMLSPVMMMVTMMVVMVMATNSVNMERTGQQKMADGSGKARMVELDQTWPLSDEFKAILGTHIRVSLSVLTSVTPGGVLGFWGGVGSMGTVFLLVVLTQRYCCRRRQDKEEAGVFKQISLKFAVRQFV